jgi:DNA-binding winged helix-turn-helix (wHTH) protein/tetratricopeptide (TPR) repeat protein
VMGQNPLGNQQLRMGEIFLNLSTEQVFKAGGEIHLSPKGFKLLRLLVEHADSLLTKKQIFDAVWPHQEVGDATLNQTISVLRKSMGFSDSVIRSVPRRGYVFNSAAIAAAQPIDSSLDNDAASDALHKDTSRIAQSAVDKSESQAARSAVDENESQVAQSAVDKHESRVPRSAVDKSEPAANLERLLKTAIQITPGYTPKANKFRWLALGVVSCIAIASSFAVTQLRPSSMLDRVNLEIRAADPGLAAAFKAMLIAELDPSVKVLSEMDVNPTGPNQLLVELTTDAIDPNTLAWTWHLTHAEKKQSQQASSLIASLGPTLRDTLPNVLPLRQSNAERQISNEAFKLYAQAMRHLSTSNLKPAKPLLERAVAIAPNNSVIISELAILSLRIGEVRNAKLYFGQLANIDADPQQQLFARYQLAIIDNQEAEALALLDQLVMDSEGKQYARTGLHFRLGNFELGKKGIAERARLGDTIANHPRFAYLTGTAALKEYSPVKARDIYLEGLKNPKITRYWRGLLSAQLGSALYMSGDLKASEVAFTQAADSFEPDRNLDEQFSARRMLLNLRVMRTTGCYSGNEIDKLQDIAVNQIGSVRAMTGYYSGRALIQIRCHDLEGAITTISNSIDISGGFEELAHQNALLNRAQVQTALGKTQAALADIATIRAKEVQKLSEAELDYVAIRAGSDAVSAKTKTCFDAVRTKVQSQRLALAQACLAQKSAIDTPGKVHFEVLQYIVAGEPSDLPGSLQATLASADPIDLREWEAFCEVASCEPALHAPGVGVTP